MKRLAKWTFCYEEKQLEELKELSKRTGIPQAVLVREALGRLLKRYRHISTMNPFSVDEARYYLAGSRAVEEEQFIKAERDESEKRRDELQYLFGRRPGRRKARR